MIIPLLTLNVPGNLQRKFLHIKSKHELKSHDGMSEAHSDFNCTLSPSFSQFSPAFPQFSVFVSCLIYVWNKKCIPRVPLLFKPPVLFLQILPPPSFSPQMNSLRPSSSPSLSASSILPRFPPIQPFILLPSISSPLLFSSASLHLPFIYSIMLASE